MSAARVLALAAALFALPALAPPVAAEPCLATSFLCSWESTSGNCNAGYGGGITVVHAGPVLLVMQRSCFPTDDWHRVNVHVNGAASAWWEGFWPGIGRGGSLGVSAPAATASWTHAGGCLLFASAGGQAQSVPCPVGPPPPPGAPWGDVLP